MQIKITFYCSWYSLCDSLQSKWKAAFWNLTITKIQNFGKQLYDITERTHYASYKTYKDGNAETNPLGMSWTMEMITVNCTGYLPEVHWVQILKTQADT